MSDTIRAFLLILSGSFFFSVVVSRIPAHNPPRQCGERRGLGGRS
ncbi:hypothetical protein [Kyrpidia sp.]|nr:hypothetical protein [Kyrpidia sp.]